MKKTIFEYEGLPITFESSSYGQMINATEMAKKFNKNPKDFFVLKRTVQYVETLHNSLIVSRKENSPIASMRSINTENLARAYPELIKVIKGGNNQQGTWVHEKIALKFAAWLSPVFELWVYNRIQELLLTGKTEMNHQKKGNVFKALRQMIDQLEEQERINQRVEERLEINSERIDEIEARLIVQDKNFLSVAAYCSLHHIPCPLDKAQKWGVQATALSRKTNNHFYQIHDPRFGRVGVYHVDVLDKIIK